jgi:hypothetical protein
MQSWPRAGRYLVSIHLITRPHRPELRANRALALSRRQRTQIDHDALTENRRCCCTTVLYGAARIPLKRSLCR